MLHLQRSLYSVTHAIEGVAQFWIFLALYWSQTQLCLALELGQAPSVLQVEQVHQSQILSRSRGSVHIG